MLCILPICKQWWRSNLILGLLTPWIQPLCPPLSPESVRPLTDADSPSTCINKMPASMPPPKAELSQISMIYQYPSGLQQLPQIQEVKIQAALSFLKYSLYAFKIIYNENSEMSFTTEDTGPGPGNRTHVHGCTQLCVCDVRAQKRLLFT